MSFHNLINSTNLSDSAIVGITLLITVFVLSVLFLLIQYVKRKIIRKRIKYIRERKSMNSMMKSKKSKMK